MRITHGALVTGGTSEGASEDARKGVQQASLHGGDLLLSDTRKTY